MIWSASDETQNDRVGSFVFRATFDGAVSVGKRTWAIHFFLWIILVKAGLKLKLAFRRSFWTCATWCQKGINYASPGLDRNENKSETALHMSDVSPLYIFTSKFVVFVAMANVSFSGHLWEPQRLVRRKRYRHQRHMPEKICRVIQQLKPGTTEGIKRALKETESPY